jgi:uncharacterized protein YbjT (DUF2867 family)
MFLYTPTVPLHPRALSMLSSPNCSYMQTKGEVEHAVLSLRFPRCFLYRPGLLDRGDSKRLIEKVGLLFLPST